MQDDVRMTGSEFFLHHRDYVIGRIRGAVFRCQYERAAREKRGADERCGSEDARQDSFHDGLLLPTDTLRLDGEIIRRDGGEDADKDKVLRACIFHPVAHALR